MPATIRGCMRPRSVFRLGLRSPPFTPQAASTIPARAHHPPVATRRLRSPAEYRVAHKSASSLQPSGQTATQSLGVQARKCCPSEQWSTSGTAPPTFRRQCPVRLQVVIESKAFRMMQKHKQYSLPPPHNRGLVWLKKELSPLLSRLLGNRQKTPITL